MPTEYTSTITKDTTLADFAMTCARASGACVTMRDDPSDAVIPDEFKPDNYYADRTVEAKAKIAKLEAMSDSDKDAETDIYVAKLRKSRRERQAESDATRANYERVLSLVRAWKPPTKDHEGMKLFMIEQIESSIKFDCYTKKQLEGAYPVHAVTGAAWFKQEMEDAKRDLAYAEKSYAEECQRCEERSKWVRDLRNSLK